MQKNRILTVVALSSIVLVGAGCSTNQPTTADLMRNHASEQSAEASLKKNLAKDWDKGTQLIDTGEKRVKRAEKDIRQAEKQLRDARKALEKGKREMAQGQKLKASSERKFRAQFPDSTLAN